MDGGNNRSMNNHIEITPRQALEIIQKLSTLDTLRLNLTDHMGIQSAIKVLAGLVKLHEDMGDKAPSLKVMNEGL